MNRSLLLIFLIPVYAFPIENEERATALDICLGCHVETGRVLDIFFSPHGSADDPLSPMNQGQCESCHGNNDAHLGDPDILPPEVTFKKKWSTPPEKQDAACLKCHNDSKRMHWPGDAHPRNDVNCVDCHTIHARKDPVLTREGELRVCGACHSDVRGQMLKVSTHPMSKLDMRCSSCHAVHGSLNEGTMKRLTLNQTCYECHADRRGPFLWEHAPVREQCTHCHVPHGSNNRSMLRTRVPFLCQQCHSMAGHPSSELAPDGTSSGHTNSKFMLVKGCLNCHPAVHGSNHPSGVKLVR